MVRFIMYNLSDIPSAIISIYIPIWLDLLFAREQFDYGKMINLHSNMVRFIICVKCFKFKNFLKFTFQYG